MSERQLNFIIALLCLNFAWDAIKVMMTMYYDRQDRMELNYRLDRLEEFLVGKTVVQCACDCCNEGETQEEDEDEGEEEAEDDGKEDEGEEDEDEEDEGEEAEEEGKVADEEESETFTADDGAVYAYKINLNTVEDTRTVEKTDEAVPSQ
jgi:hypothetical protein